MTDGDVPSCPAGHGPMQLRTARQGRYAGRRFWSCPTCRHIVDASGTDIRQNYAVAGDGRLAQASLLPGARDIFPRQVIAAARDPVDQVAFFQAAALPEAVVEAVYLSDIDPGIVRSLAQWRLDYPLPRDVGLDPALRPVLAVAEAILTRGSTPLCSPALDAALSPVPDMLDAAGVEAAVQRVALRPTIRFLPRSFESDEERLLAGQISELVEREGLAWTLIPQVSLSSLSPSVDGNAGERGDLLLVHPQQGAILVEVDGAQHTQHLDRDAGRDRALEGAGVRTVRVPAAQVRERTGPALDALMVQLRSGDLDAPPESGLSFVLRWAKWLHQIQVSLLLAIKTGWLEPDQPWTVGVVLPTPLRSDLRRANDLATLAVSEVRELIIRVARLHGLNVAGATRVVLIEQDGFLDELDLLIGPADGSVDALPTPAGLPRFLFADGAFPGSLLRITVSFPLLEAEALHRTQPQRWPLWPRRPSLHRTRRVASSAKRSILPWSTLPWMLLPSHPA